MPRRLKDIDAAERALRLKALVWALCVGFGGGVPIGMALSQLLGMPALLSQVLSIGVGFAGTYYMSLFITHRAGRAAQTIYHPSGESTPRRREYSRAAALAAQGKYEDAAVAYEAHVTEHPSDPDPYFTLARLCLDHLDRPEEAIHWYSRVRDEARVTEPQALIATQEIANIYLRRLRTPRKAIPELARLCERFSHTPAAEHARRELDEMRRLLAREREDGIDFDAEFLKRFDGEAEERA
jgi:tetratricopeptide (TPR) repeat protein